MSRLVPVNWQKFEKFLLSEGCKFTRQKGDHRIYHRLGLIRPIVLPAIKHIPIFIIKNNLKLLNIDVEKYISKINNL